MPSLFDLPRVDPPDIRTLPAIAPGSASSERAALCLSSPFRRKSCREIMMTLAASSHPMSREELSLATGLPINVITARVADLRPMWLDTSGWRWSHAKPGLKVDGLSLTESGRARCVASEAR